MTGVLIKIDADELDLCGSDLKHFGHMGQHRALSSVFFLESEFLEQQYKEEEEFQKLLVRLLAHQVSLVCVDL